MSRFWRSPRPCLGFKDHHVHLSSLNITPASKSHPWNSPWWCLVLEYHHNNVSSWRSCPRRVLSLFLSTLVLSSSLMSPMSSLTLSRWRWRVTSSSHCCPSWQGQRTAPLQRTGLWKQYNVNSTYNVTDDLTFCEHFEPLKLHSNFPLIPASSLISRVDQGNPLDLLSPLKRRERWMLTASRLSRRR